MTNQAKPQSPSDLNVMAFRPHPPIQTPQEIWKSEFPRSKEMLSKLSVEEREKLLRMDHFDYKHAMTRERLIFDAETKIWIEKLDKCKQNNPMHANSACQSLTDILNERVAYENSYYSVELGPKLSPGLPDLGHPPTRETYGLD
jgi:hypothetical protein